MTEVLKNLPASETKIAVLMAAYNGAAWIKDQVESILQQTGVRLSIYISIDHSEDKTLEIVQELASVHPSVVLLPYGDHFGSAGRNFYRLLSDERLNFADFDCVALADQDDIWLPHKLIRASHFIRHEGYDAFSSDVVAFWQDGTRRYIKKSYPLRRLDYFFEAAGPGCTYVICSSLAVQFRDFLINNRAAAHQVELHDWLLYAYSRHNGFRWYIDNRSLMLYRQHQSNQVGANIGWQAAKLRLSQVKNNWYRQQVNNIINAVAPEKLDVLTSRVYLIRHIRTLRRRPRDQLILLLLLVSTVF